MALVTFRCLDGADRGRVFENVDTPITIGREEGNTIQLNDERVSRFHLKIQEDHDRVVLTDLESTNGTKVNGEDMQLCILRFGDLIHVGRSVLLFGSRDQIAQRLSQLRKISKSQGNPFKSSDGKSFDPENLSSLDFELDWKNCEEIQEALLSLEPPGLPDRMSPGQRAQLSELLDYLHVRIRRLLKTVRSEKKGDNVTLAFHEWQELVDLQARLAEYLRDVGEPDADEG
jgi:pSer/pThr/pTyr-binding forkhead associated (FHA) protein